MTQHFKLYSVLVVLWMISCSPDRDNDFHLPDPSGAPQFSVELMQGDSNRVIITDLSDGNFQRLWDLPDGNPKNSGKAIDTIAYSKAGEYTITLYVSKTDGSGTVSSSQKIIIAKDAPVLCNPNMALLTGDCGPLGKCWTFTTEAGAVKVGPSYDDFSWYTSPVNGLQGAQYDDAFCFTFDDLVFQYNNNGQSVDPWDGYQAKDHNPGISEFIYLTGTGINGKDQIVLPDDQFMGVWDSDNVIDVITLSENLLVIRARLVMQNGTPAAEGWFELTFVPR